MRHRRRKERTTKQKRKPPVDDIQILDREGFAKELRDAIQSQCAGSNRAAAQRIGVAPGTIDRLTSGRSSSVKRETLRLVEPLMPDNSAAASALAPPFVRQALTAYEALCIEVIERATTARPDEAGSRATTLKAVLKRVSSDAPVTARDMIQCVNGGYKGPLFDDLVRLLGGNRNRKAVGAGNGIAPYRYAVAILRTIEPLLEAAQSSGVERSMSELSFEEFRDFIEMGWEREQILLDRGSDLARAQRSGQTSLSARISELLTAR